MGYYVYTPREVRFGILVSQLDFIVLDDMDEHHFDDHGYVEPRWASECVSKRRGTAE